MSGVAFSLDFLFVFDFVVFFFACGGESSDFESIFPVPVYLRAPGRSALGYTIDRMVTYIIRCHGRLVNKTVASLWRTEDGGEAKADTRA
jgi:hypothetical protein